MIAIFIALGLVLVAGLVIIPAIDEAHARSATALERYKGQQGNLEGHNGGCGRSCTG